MGFLDNLLGKGKAMANDAAAEAKKLAVDNKDKVQTGIDKAEQLADKATKGKYTDKIAGVGDKAGGYVDGLKADETPGTVDGELAPPAPGSVPPPVTPPSP